MGIRSCGAGGGQGIGIRVACFASKFHHQRSGFVASITDRFSRVRGLEAATRPAARPVSTAAPAMPRRKRDTERGSGLSKSSVKSRSNSVAKPQSKPLSYATAGSGNRRIALLKRNTHHRRHQGSGHATKESAFSGTTRILFTSETRPKPEFDCTRTTHCFAESTAPPRNAPEFPDTSL